MKHRPGLITSALIAVAALAALQAQGRPSIDVTPVVESDGVHAGTNVKLALRVSLPDGIHVQSDKPRDPMLIATRLTVEPAAGVTTSQIVYPPATDFAQKGQSTPLAVFAQQFVVGIAAAVARDVAPGVVQLPVRLRYQACDATTCYAPARQDVTFELRVVPQQTALTLVEPALFSRLHLQP